MRLIDLHNDAITNLLPKQFAKYAARCQKAGVDTILVSVWTTEMHDPLKIIKECWRIVDSVDTQIKLLLHIEDAWFVDEENIDELIVLKPFSVGLTWNTRNALASGAHADGGFTQLGRNVIQKLINSDVLIDLAHLNKQSFFEAVEIMGGHKLVCTHTCFEDVNPHPRNLDRCQIQTIVDSGGLIGLTLVGEFLSSGKSAAMQDVYNHIKYFVDNFGESNLCIGTDFFGTTNLPKGLRRYKDFPRFKKFLLEKGLGHTTIDKIFHINCNDLQRINCNNSSPNRS